MTFDIKEEMLSLLDFELKKDEWDRVPMAFVYQEPDEKALSEGDTKVLTIMALALDGHLPTMIDNMAANIWSRNSTPLPTEGKVMATILISEGWGLKEGALTRDEIKEWVASGKPYKDHPQAIESKWVMGVHNTGEGPVLQAEALSLMVERGVEPSRQFQEGGEGNLPQVMKALFVALYEHTGV